MERELKDARNMIKRQESQIIMLKDQLLKSRMNSQSKQVVFDRNTPVYSIDECFERISQLVREKPDTISDRTYSMLDQIDHSFKFEFGKLTQKVKKLEEENQNLQIALKTRVSNRSYKCLLYENTMLRSDLAQFKKPKSEPIVKRPVFSLSDVQHMKFDKFISLMHISSEKLICNGKIVSDNTNLQIPVGKACQKIVEDCCREVQVANVSDLLPFVRTMRRLVKTRFR